MGKTLHFAILIFTILSTPLTAQEGVWSLEQCMQYAIDNAPQIKQQQLYNANARQNYIASVANLYYTLLMLDAQYEISSETAEKWFETVNTMRAMKEAGMTNEGIINDLGKHGGLQRIQVGQFTKNKQNRPTVRKRATATGP